MGHLEINTTDHFKGISASHIKGQARVEITRINHRSHIHAMENVTLTPKEQARLQVLNSLLAGHMTLDQAATLLGLSSRHTRRILSAYRRNGADALAHGLRGRKPANAVSEATRSRVVHLAGTIYEGPTTPISQVAQRTRGHRHGQDHPAAHPKPKPRWNVHLAGVSVAAERHLLCVGG